MYAGGAVLVIAGCIWGHFLQEGSMQIFGMAIFLGLGNSIILVMSLSMTTRLIGKDTVRTDICVIFKYASAYFCVF